jgi:hypothetical protein
VRGGGAGGGGGGVVVAVAWCVQEAATHAEDVLVVVDVGRWVVVVVADVGPWVVVVGPWVVVVAVADATFRVAQFVPTKVTKGR